VIAIDAIEERLDRAEQSGATDTVDMAEFDGDEGLRLVQKDLNVLGNLASPPNPFESASRCWISRSTRFRSGSCSATGSASTPSSRHRRAARPTGPPSLSPRRRLIVITASLYRRDDPHP